MVFLGGQRAEINEYESLITDVVIKKSASLSRGRRPTWSSYQRG